MDTTPLTYMQQRLLAGADDGKLWLSFDLAGELDVGALLDAVGVLVARHDALRVRVARDPSGTVRQYAVAPEQETPDITLQQVESDSYDQFRTHVEARLVDELHCRYDLECETGARFFLFRLTPERHALLAVFSRFAVDGRSRVRLAGELWETYAALQAGRTGPNAPPTPGFLPAVRRLIALHGKRATTTNARYWEQRLAPDPRFAGLGALQARGGPDAPCDVRSLWLRESAVGRLATAAAASRCSVFEVFLARAASVVVAATGLDRLVVTALNDFRAAGDRDVVGAFVSSVPIVLDREDGTATAVSVRQVQREALRARVHGYVSSEVMAGCQERLAGAYAVRVADAVSFSYLDHSGAGAPPERVGGLAIGRGPGLPPGLLTAPVLDVTVTARPTETFVNLVFNRGVFAAAVVERVVGGLVATLGAEVAAPAAAGAG